MLFFVGGLVSDGNGSLNGDLAYTIRIEDPLTKKLGYDIPVFSFVFMGKPIVFGFQRNMDILLAGFSIVA